MATARKNANRIRIKDIAKAAGVSVSTVSFVLNGRAKEMRVSDKAVAKVRTAARTLGYVPHITARRLRARRTSTEPLILAVATSLETPLVLAGPIVRGVQLFGAKLLADQGIPLQITIETFEHGRLQELPGLLDGTRFNGVVLTNTIPEDDAFLAEHPVPLPLVLFGRLIPGYSCVYADEDRVGREAAGRFLQQGVQHPCLVRPKRMSQSVERRYQGFKSAYDDAGQPQPAEAVCDGLDEFAAREGLLAFLKQGHHVDAVYALTGVLAVGARVALRLCDLRPHQDVLLVGEDYRLNALRDPTLTSFDHPSVAMAQEAARLVVEIMRTGESKPIRVLFDGSRLVRRETAEEAEA